MGGCCGQSAQHNLDQQRAQPAAEEVYVNYYPDGSTEETVGRANAEARQRSRGGTVRLKS